MKKLSLLLILVLIPLVFATTKIDGNKAYINHDKGYIEQEPYLIGSNTQTTIKFNKNSEYDSYDLCFNFNGYNINILEMDKKELFGLLKKDYKKIKSVDNYDCIKSFIVDNNAEFSFKARYKGKDTIKYDILILPSEYNLNFKKAEKDNELIILDPYLIGDLSNNDNILAYFTFDNTLATTVGKQINSTYMIKNASAAYDFGITLGGGDIVSGNPSQNTDVTYTTDGAFFTGSNNLSVPFSQSFNFTDFTIITKVTPSSVTGDHTITTNRNADKNGAWWLAQSGATFKAALRNSSGFCTITTGNLITSNQNNVLAFKKDGNNITLYVDGVNSGSTLCTNWVSNAEHIDIGVVQDVQKFVGNMSYLTYYNRPLTENEIKLQYNQGNFSTNILNQDNTSLQLSYNDYIFYGNNQYMTFADPDNFTISAWVNIGAENNQRIISKYYWTLETQVDYNFMVNGSDLEFYIYDESAWYIARYSNSILKDTWHHVAAKKEGSTISVYVDGIKGSTTATLVNFTNPNNNAYILVGGSSRQNYLGSGNEYYNGSIDELILYNYSLSDSEIEVLAGGFNNSINFTILDAETGVKIDYDNITINLYNDAKNFSTSKSSTTGNIFFSGVPSGTLRIHGFGDGHDPNIIILTISGENTANNQEFYLTNSTSDNIGDITLVVRDETNSLIEGANIKIYSQNVSTGLFNLLTDRYSNVKGEALVSLVKDTVFYKFTIYYEGLKCYETSSPFYITSDITTITFVCVQTGDYIEVRDSYNNITSTLSFNNNTNVTGTFTLEATQNLDGEFCLEVRELTSYGKGYIVVGEDCQNVTSYLSSINVNASNRTKDTTFIGLAYYTPRSQSIKKLIGSWTHTFIKNIKPDFANTGLYIIYLLIVVIFMLLIKTPIAAVIVSSGIFFMATLTPLVNLSTMGKSEAAVGIIILIFGIIAAYVMRKKDVQ